MRAKKNRETNIFSASVVDLFASGLGVFLIVSIIALVNQKKEDSFSTTEQEEKLEKLLSDLQEKKAEILKLQAMELKDGTAAEKVEFRKQQNEIIKSFADAEQKIKEAKFQEEIKKLQQTLVLQKTENQRLKKQVNDLKDEVAESDTGSLTPGIAVALKNVHFYSGTANPIEPYASAELEILAKRLNKKPETKIEVSGHIYQSKDDIESGKANDEFNLSYKRARRVCDMLIDFDVDEDRLRCVGYGAKRYLYLTNDSYSKEAQLNRRVEVEVLE